MDSEIQQYAGDILAHPRFQQLRTFCHHGLDNSVYDHSVAVAEAACQIARLMRLSESERLRLSVPRCCMTFSAMTGTASAFAVI